MTQFITLAGQKQVGKDTSARMLKQTILLQTDAPAVHVVHFADALKAACNIIFGIPLEDMETEVGKQKLTKVKWPQDYRHGFGDAALRKDGVESATNVWVPYTHTGPLSWHHSATHQGAEGPRYMTTREVLQFVGTELFRNQLDPDVWLNSVFMQPWEENDVVIIADARFPNEAMLGREHGLLISIERDTGIENDGHASENALAGYDGYHNIVSNNGSFEELNTSLAAILSNHKLLV